MKASDMKAYALSYPEREILHARDILMGEISTASERGHLKTEELHLNATPNAILEFAKELMLDGFTCVTKNQSIIVSWENPKDTNEEKI